MEDVEASERCEKKGNNFYQGLEGVVGVEHQIWSALPHLMTRCRVEKVCFGNCKVSDCN